MSDLYDDPFNRTHWAALGLLVVLVLGIVIVPMVATDDGFGGVCESELGPEWEMTAYIDYPGEDHYEIECERSTGILSSEKRWISVPKSEITYRTGFERTIEFYRGVLGR